MIVESDFLMYTQRKQAIWTDSGSLQRIKEEKEYHMKSKIFSDKFFNSQLWKLAVPIMIQSLMLASVAAADAFYAGRC